MTGARALVSRALGLAAVAATILVGGCARDGAAEPVVAAAGFDDKSLYEMGYAIKHITPVTPELSAMALKVLRASADQGNAEAMVQLGEMYLAGRAPLEPGQDSNQEAMKWWNASWEHGATRGHHNLGLMYYGVAVPGTGGKGAGVVPQDYDKAFQYFKSAADKGDTKSLRYVGISYEKGQGVQQDYAEAAKYYAKNGEGGFYLANLLLEGKGMPQDVPKAIAMYAEVAKQDGGGQADTYSAETLGRLYEDGRYVKADPEQSLQYYQLAASKGSRTAQAKLTNFATTLYRDGFAALKAGRYDVALPLLIRSAKLGNPDALRMTGNSHK